MQEITVFELKQMKDEHKDFQLIDVREEYEYDLANLGGELIPLGTILTSVDKISKEKPVVVYCRSGSRSATAISHLEKNHGFTNLINLKGGILAYAKEVDTSIPTY